MNQIAAVLGLCIAVSGDVIDEDVQIVESSGYPAYDEALVAAVNDWKYRPYELNGEPARVCTKVRFLYRQR